MDTNRPCCISEFNKLDHAIGRETKRQSRERLITSYLGKLLIFLFIVPEKQCHEHNYACTCADPKFSSDIPNTRISILKVDWSQCRTLQKQLEISYS
jgi:hypothetical protein